LVDISDPESPEIISTLDMQTPISGLDVQDSLAFVVIGHDGLAFVDVSDPRSPEIVGMIDVPGRSVDVTVEDMTAYLISGHDGLDIIEFTDPTNPTWLGSIDVQDAEWNSVQIANGRAFIPSRWAFFVVDVRDPMSPELAARLNYDDVNGTIPGERGTLLNQFMYLAGQFGVHVFDVSTCIGDCLGLTVDHLVAGETSTIDVAGGRAGSLGAVVWGLGGEPTRLINVDGWCATFGFELPLQNLSQRVVGAQPFDATGRLSFERRVPEGAQGLRVLFQAAQRGTCPDECTSNVVEATVE